MPFDHLNRSFIDLKKVAFSVGQEAENDFKVPFDKMNHRFIDFIQIAFWAGQEAKMSSQCLANTRNVALLTSPTLHFVLVQRPKIS